jgi:hypothetical protein
VPIPFASARLNALQTAVRHPHTYTLKGEDNSSIDFMCLTMINPVTSWFEIVELPTVAQEMTIPSTDNGKKVTFDKKTQS